VREPRWIAAEAARAIHAELIAEHGGAPGIRDANILEATLARPRNLLACGKPSLAELAAAYGYAFARNHPFVDGNKRMALAAIDVFLQLNGHELAASEEIAAATIRALAEGRLSENELARWVRENSRRL
jgi:death-on-curing protein